MVKVSRVPLIEELDSSLPPVTFFELFRREPFCFFLDSSMDPKKLGRYSFMGGNPFLILKSRGSHITIRQNDAESSEEGNPLDVLGRCLESYRLENIPGAVPFTGGAVGYFSYDMCRFIEDLPSAAIDDLKLPECYFGFYDLVLVWDNLLHKAFVASTGFPELEESLRITRAHERLQEFKKRLGDLPKNTSIQASGTKLAAGKVRFKGNFTRQEYIRAVEKARQYIINGDIFEVNLSQRFEAELSISPYELYLRLRDINPAPFSAYLDFNEVAIVSSSPERFLCCRGDRVETRPIKGTRPRGQTPEEDRRLAQELLSSSKDRAENMMIVDLERNDLGRVCRFGTVKVTELAILETYPTVFHLTSTVVGQLREEVSKIDLLKATLPGGSITGAPKIRSMEIIDELEPTRRSIYTGNIGYISFDGNLDLNIVIRTYLIKGDRAYFQVGGAVVYDSNPEEEYQETLDKGRALVNALSYDR